MAEKSISALIADFAGHATPNRPVLVIEDPKQAERQASRVLTPHRLGTRSEFGLELYDAPLAEVLLFGVKYSGRPTAIGTRPTHECIVTYVLRGGVSAETPSGTVMAKAGEWMLSPPTATTRVGFDADTVFVGMRIPAELLQRRLGILTGRPVHRQVLRSRVIGSGPGLDILTSGFRQALHVADSRTTPALLAAGVEDALLTSVLLGVPGSHTDDLFAAAEPVAGRAVRLAASIMHDEGPHCSSLPDLAARVGISMRRLQSGFRSAYGTTPSHYLRDIQLDMAQRILLDADPRSTSVADVASAAGFTHLGRFSASFRGRFGVDPSTLLRASGVRS